MKGQEVLAKVNSLIPEDIIKGIIQALCGLQEGSRVTSPDISMFSLGSTYTINVIIEHRNLNRVEMFQLKAKATATIPKLCGQFYV